MATHWVIDHDFRLESEPDEPTYEERTYCCPHCRKESTGFQVEEKSPAAFFLQPHSMYSMGQKEFDHWVAVLRQHFPDSPMLAELGKSWYPAGGLTKRAWRFLT